MEVQEFSSSFSTLLNSYAITAEDGRVNTAASVELDEYEKSLFLTNAQEEIVLSLYNGRNSSLQGFEETEELRRYLSTIIKEAKLNPMEDTDTKPFGIDSNSKFFELPPDLWFITYESVSLTKGECEGHNNMQVVPVTQDEYHRIKKNPFRGANKRRALRLDLSDNIVEIVCNYKVNEYYIRYLRQPKPIILTSLDDDTQLRGERTPMTSELPESLHLKILNRAVEMALQSRGYIKQNNNSE